jgi:hypothetical protein
MHTPFNLVEDVIKSSSACPSFNILSWFFDVSGVFSQMKKPMGTSSDRLAQYAEDGPAKSFHL